MEIELYTDMEGHRFVVDEETAKFIKTHLDKGKDFDVFFPDYEFEI